MMGASILQGENDLAKRWREESIEEMEHADRFVERIIFLETLPNVQSLNPLRIGQNVREVIESDLAAEYKARNLYAEATEYCQRIGDRVSRILFEELMADDEGHIDFLETQQTLIEQISIKHYAQKHVGRPEKGEHG